MFILPAYDPTAIAMLGFGILAAAALASDFDRLANFLLRLGERHDDTRDRFSASGAGVCALSRRLRDRRLAERFKKMATDLLAKADDFEEVPSERVRHEEQN